MVHTHHANVRCVDCGEKHSPGAMLDCVDVLKDRVAQLDQECEGWAAKAKDQDERIALAVEALKEVLGCLHRAPRGHWSVQFDAYFDEVMARARGAVGEG